MYKRTASRRLRKWNSYFYNRSGSYKPNWYLVRWQYILQWAINTKPGGMEGILLEDLKRKRLLKSFLMSFGYLASVISWFPNLLSYNLSNSLAFRNYKTLCLSYYNVWLSGSRNWNTRTNATWSSRIIWSKCGILEYGTDVLSHWISSWLCHRSLPDRPTYQLHRHHTICYLHNFRAVHVFDSMGSFSRSRCSVSFC